MRGSVPGANRLQTSKKPPKKLPVKGKKKPVDRMTITRAKGGYVVEHSGDENHAPWEPGMKHVVPNSKALGQHVQQHMGDEPEAADNMGEESQE